MAANNLSSELLDAESSQVSDSQSSSSSIIGFSQVSNASASSNTHSRAQRTALDSLIQLTPSDRKTAQRVIKAIVGDEEEEKLDFDQEELEQLRQLQVILMLNMKAEIQAIDNMGDLSSWLDEKMAVA